MKHIPHKVNCRYRVFHLQEKATPRRTLYRLRCFNCGNLSGIMDLTDLTTSVLRQSGRRLPERPGTKWRDYEGRAGSNPTPVFRTPFMREPWPEHMGDTIAAIIQEWPLPATTHTTEDLVADVPW